MWFDGSEPETCARCGFDSEQWRRQDAAAVLDGVGDWWRRATDGISGSDLNRRPAPGVWSALEYGLHSALVLPILRIGIEIMLALDGTDVRDPCPDLDIEDAGSPLTLDPEPLIADLEREGAAIGALVASHHSGWEHLGRMDNGTWWQAEATLLHAVHDTTHHFLDVGEGLARIGAALPTAEVTVASVTASDDTQSCPPFQAVRLRPAEASADEPAPRQAAMAVDAGRPTDVTLSGVGWDLLRPGTRVSAGTALLELSYPADPGWYAWVRRPGPLRPGTSGVLSPP